ncbi:glycoside hydrolase family 88 protein [Pseudostreptobacillus hongkongensis]|uniref:glycoside hydrolase family 88 protein n=1 Tax=Pseudostreptobacillus hongkongensis TaxID=1162717 RepID=UPI0028D01EBF|nr:glycoside hydrolase family 88 protein [Pseudostreptobacillus hongkongensis]
MELNKETLERYSEDIELSKEMLYNALHNALVKIDKNIEYFINLFPRPNSVNNIYPGILNGGEWDDWTSGFWTGILWLAYEITKDEKYRKVAEFQLKSYKERIENKNAVDHHDLGFLYIPSAVAQYKITNSEDAKKTGIMAAKHLITRFREKGEFIQAWGELGNPDNHRLIIDCNLNIPLLFWASEVTGEEKYKEIAQKHVNTAANTVVRKDGSTFHTYYFDVETGKPLRGSTAQGSGDDSSWARGQAWGVYGFPLAYKYLKDEKFINLYKTVTNYFLNNLPKDNVCYWDLCFDDTSGEEKDTSAAAIAICGMLEMNKNISVDDKNKKIYDNAAKHIMKSLIENYTTKKLKESNGLLKEAVYSKPHGVGVNECCIWGDYFYMEALVRFLKPDLKIFW